MDGARLSASERRALGEIEAALRSEAAGLDRRLRDLRVGLLRQAWESCGVRGLAVLGLAALSVTLLVAGVRTALPVVIWAFAITWTITLGGVFLLLADAADGFSGPAD